MLSYCYMDCRLVIGGCNDCSAFIGFKLPLRNPLERTGRYFCVQDYIIPLTCLLGDTLVLIVRKKTTTVHSYLSKPEIALLPHREVC